MKNKGCLIVLEGTDGCGKATQTKRLLERMQTEKYPVHAVSFPRYDNPSAALVQMYLQGQFGTDPHDVNPYAASVFYAVDRYAAWKQEMQRSYEQGHIILCDRYTTSNAVFQCEKLSADKKPAFLEWLTDLEYDKMGIPAPDLVIWLDMPVQATLAHTKTRPAKTDNKIDIHEKDADYLERCYENAKYVARALGWVPVRCTDDDGKIKSIDDIHNEIWEHVKLMFPA